MRHSSTETDRLLLERWDHEAHAPAFAAVNAHPDIVAFLGGGDPISRSDSDAASLRFAEHWERFGFGLWAVRVKCSGAMIGFVGLSHPLWWPEMSSRVEVGWRLAREEWGKGYATEGAREALRLGFSVLGLEEIISLIQAGNERSVAVARRLGMDPEAELPHPQRPIRVIVMRRANPCSSS